MILDLDRPLETATLLDLVSYPDPGTDQPATEESIEGEDAGKSRWRIFGLYRRSLSARNPRKWLPIKKLRSFRARPPRLDVA